MAFGLQVFLITNTVSNLESNPAYQFCMGQEIPKSVPTNTPYITDKILRARVVIMLLGLVSSEFLIYLYILHDQQRHNDKHLQQKIINKVTFKNRKEKNIITLKGQICIFATKMATIILILITKILNLQLFNVNSYPFLTILSPFITAFAQILSSHEIRRYLMSKLNWKIKTYFEMHVLNLFLGHTFDVTNE